ncbi:antimicrobial peptide microplusin [Ixodes scapularis]|uniref:antimicrobial peptide microplusin n=1 Tax=Ixodes scapularis TaxID=6945 RepID=UPI001125335A|nr:antimicrobial peptide microplusin [Ixodes scapularis]
MNSLSVCLVLVLFVVATSARQSFLCSMDDKALQQQLDCHRQFARVEMRRQLDRVNAELKCKDDLCSIRYLCRFANTEEALRQVFSWYQLSQFHQLVNRCIHGVQAARPGFGRWRG